MPPRTQEETVKDQLLSTAVTAARLSVSIKTARRLIQKGELRAHRVGCQWRVSERDLQDYLARRSNRATA
jgi:excisionase family DNA binding protein